MPTSPWFFYRDEVDLLEEDLDDIYDVYDDETLPQVMEQRVIQEQLDTEDRLEAEWSLSMNPSWLKSKPRPVVSPSVHAEHIAQESESLQMELKRDVHRPPLYEAVFMWTDAAFDMGKSLYELEIGDREAAFRMYVNAKLIPIKLASAMSGEIHDDPIALAVAQKEYRLTVIYLERVIACLASFEGLLRDRTYERMMKHGEELIRALQASLTRLERRARGSSI
jgi:hypothetical protein